MKTSTVGNRCLAALVLALAAPLPTFANDGMDGGDFGGGGDWGSAIGGIIDSFSGSFGGGDDYGGGYNYGGDYGGSYYSPPGYSGYPTSTYSPTYSAPPAQQAPPPPPTNRLPPRSGGSSKPPANNLPTACSAPKPGHSNVPTNSMPTPWLNASLAPPPTALQEGIGCAFPGSGHGSPTGPGGQLEETEICSLPESNPVDPPGGVYLGPESGGPMHNPRSETPTPHLPIEWEEPEIPIHWESEPPHMEPTAIAGEGAAAPLRLYIRRTSSAAQAIRSNIANARRRLQVLIGVLRSVIPGPQEVDRIVNRLPNPPYDNERKRQIRNAVNRGDVNTVRNLLTTDTPDTRRLIQTATANQAVNNLERKARNGTVTQADIRNTSNALQPFTTNPNTEQDVQRALGGILQNSNTIGQLQRNLATASASSPQQSSPRSPSSSPPGGGNRGGSSGSGSSRPSGPQNGSRQAPAAPTPSGSRSTPAPTPPSSVASSTPPASNGGPTPNSGPGTSTVSTPSSPTGNGPTGPGTSVTSSTPTGPIGGGRNSGPGTGSTISSSTPTSGRTPAGPGTGTSMTSSMPGGPTGGSRNPGPGAGSTMTSSTPATGGPFSRPGAGTSMSSSTPTNAGPFSSPRAGTSMTSSMPAAPNGARPNGASTPGGSMASSMPPGSLPPGSTANRPLTSLMAPASQNSNSGAAPNAASTAGTPNGSLRSSQTVARVVLRNADQDFSVLYNLNGAELEMAPGQRQTLSADAPWIVEFDRGGDFGTGRYKLVAGGNYKFVSTDYGWSLVKELAPPQDEEPQFGPGIDLEASLERR